MALGHLSQISDLKPRSKAQDLALLPTPDRLASLTAQYCGHVTACSESDAACMLQGIGYTEDDSAGQTNIFAVEVTFGHFCIDLSSQGT